MHKYLHSCLVGLCMLVAFGPLVAQDAAADTTTEKAWTTGAGIGLDAAQLLQINPRVGAGQNRLGFGGAVTAFGNYRRGRLAWDNAAGWQFGVQRLGSGVVAQGGDQRIPFQKAIDLIQIDSKVGYQASETSKWFYAANANFITQLTPTYLGTAEFPGNFLTDISGANAVPQARFMSPGQLTLSTGIDYKPNDHWSLYFSPLAGRFIIVANDDIVLLGVHGNPVEKDADGNIVSAENVDAQLGSLLRLAYTNKFLGDKLTYTSAIQLFSNYLREPQNVDLQFWNNDVAMEIFKGFQLALSLNMYYDHDILVQITDYDAPNGVSGLGRRLSLTQQLLLKYAVTF